MSDWPRALLLDTHAAIWLAEGRLTDETVERIVFAGLADGVFVSPVSAWEIGLLARPRADGRPSVQFRPDPVGWFSALMAKPIVKPAPLTATIAIAASFLPDPFHSDPADRLLVATAREMNVPLLTRNAEILAYGEAGNVETRRC
jgi:PIN domain nuclease of toxin-antitoxin system